MNCIDSIAMFGADTIHDLVASLRTLARDPLSGNERIRLEIVSH